MRLGISRVPLATKFRVAAAYLDGEKLKIIAEWSGLTPGGICHLARAFGCPLRTARVRKDRRGSAPQNRRTT